MIENNKDPIKEDILDPKEELYLKVIKKRDDKLKKMQKKCYFFDNSKVWSINNQFISWLPYR